MGVHHPSRSFPRFLPEVAVDAEVMEDVSLCFLHAENRVSGVLGNFVTQISQMAQISHIWSLRSKSQENL